MGILIFASQLSSGILIQLQGKANIMFRKISLAFTLFILAQDQVSSQGYPRAQCRITWNIPTNCNAVQTKIQNQMNLWKETPAGKEACPGTSKQCPRKFEGIDQVGRVTGYHLTPAKSYKDRVSFEFTENGSSCKVVGFSKSTVSYAFLDFGTNYCNLRNLLDGANLSQGNGFTDQTSTRICTQYDKINCARF